MAQASPLGLKPLTLSILVDRREKAPYTFAGLDRPDLEISVETATLQTGDYALVGFETLAAVERKGDGLSDLFRTVSHRRGNFSDELRRMDALPHAGMVVVEATWADIIHRPPPGSTLPPSAVRSAIVGWQRAFPRVKWAFCDGRRAGEVATLYLLLAWAEAMLAAPQSSTNENGQ